MKRLLCLLMGATLLTGCAEVVDSGNVGIKKTYGKVFPESLAPGFYWYNPFSSSITELSTQSQKWESETETYTKDIQQGKINFTLTYHLSPRKAYITYSTVGQDWAARLIPQLATSAIKNEFGRWNAVNVIANRGLVQDRIERVLAYKLAKVNVVLDGLEITDVNYSEAFENAVEAKEVAVQNAIGEQNRTVQIREKATQQVISAKADAEAMQVKAKALESNPKLVEYEAVLKWDGKLPTNMYGGAAMPFVNVK